MAVDLPPLISPVAVVAPAADAVALLDGGTITVRLRLDKDRLLLVAHDGPKHTGLIEVDVEKALLILADKRFERLWQPLLDKAGADLSILRDQLVARAKAQWLAANPGASRSQSMRLMSKQAGATYRYAGALAQAGQIDAALQLLDEAVAARAVSRDRDALLETSLLAVNAASTAGLGGRPAISIARLEAARPLLLGSPTYAINLEVNRAALLAESGRYADALAAVETTLAAYYATPGSSVRVDDGNDHFTTIRVCALYGLGRFDESQAIWSQLRTGSYAVENRNIVLDAPTAKLWRAGVCMRNVNVIAGLLKDIHASRGALLTLPLVLQPGMRDANVGTFLAELRADPEVVTLFAERYRVLPAALTPALNGWRDAVAQ